MSRSHAQPVKTLWVEVSPGTLVGHCSRRRIEDIVRKIKPEVLFPVHEEYPKVSEGLADKVYERIEKGRAHKI